MKQYTFKTNINCSGCIEKLIPFLTANPDITKWKVDTTDLDKILTVDTENLEKKKK